MASYNDKTIPFVFVKTVKLLIQSIVRLLMLYFMIINSTSIILMILNK